MVYIFSKLLSKPVRRKWSRAELKCLMDSQILSSQRVPGKNEIQRLQRQYPVLASRTWKNIKYQVSNMLKRK